MSVGARSAGSVYQRCGCRSGAAGRGRGSRCPLLGRPGHGSWFFSADLPRPVGGRRRRVRRGGYPTREEAAAARDRLCPPGGGRPVTVGDWLDAWLGTRARLRTSTLRGYDAHVRRYLNPCLGGILLGELDIGHLEQAFTRLLRQDGLTLATARRAYCTLRSALNAAVRERLIPDNPARFLKLPAGWRPHAVVWTRRRVRQWERDGIRPPVAVWTPAQLAAFLAAIASHPLYPVFHLIALRGLRRGEACGLRWSDIDLDHAVAHVNWQIQHTGRSLVMARLKTDTSRRVLALDKLTIEILRAHRHLQEEQFSAIGIVPSGYVFTSADGSPLSPDYLTRMFRQLVVMTDLPPVRLHDLRHGAASLAIAAGADLKVISDQLGHSSIVLTAEPTSASPPNWPSRRPRRPPGSSSPSGSTRPAGRGPGARQPGHLPSSAPNRPGATARRGIPVQPS